MIARRDNAAVNEPTPADDPARERFIELLRQQQRQGGWLKLVLSGPRPAAGAEADLQRVTVRPVQLRGGPVLSFVSRHATKDLTHNHAPDEGLALIAGEMG